MRGSRMVGEALEPHHDIYCISMSNRAPLISILLPYRNAAPWLQECLESIAAQSLGNFEVMMVNDGSVDDSRNIALAFAAADTRFLAVDNPGSGLVAANRFALSLARGTLLTRMDADDLMPGQKLEWLAAPLLQKGRRFLSTGKVQFFPEEAVGIGTRYYADWLNERCDNQDHWDWIWRECVVPSPCWMAFREDLLDIRAFEYDIYPDDYELMFRFYRAGFSVLPMNELCHLWRQHPRRMSHGHEGFKTEAFMRLKVDMLQQCFDLSTRKLCILGHGKKGKLLTDLLPAGQLFQWFSERSQGAGNVIRGQHIYGLEQLKYSDDILLISTLSTYENHNKIYQCLMEQGFVWNKTLLRWC